MSRKAAAVVEAVKSYRSADGSPRFVRDVTTLSGYRNQYGAQTFIVDATLGCDLDAFKEYFAQEHDISMPSSCDGLFLWKDPQGNNDKATRLDRDYSGETLLFVEFKHAPIFKMANGRVDFLHAGQMNQKRVFAGLEGYLYRKIRLIPDTLFRCMLEQGQLYI